MDKKIKKAGVIPTLLIILDGFGLTKENNPGNAITSETAPNFFHYFNKYPSTTLIAHGKDVGLFANQEGNSEAGHFNIGAGRVVEQDLVRISHAIKDGTFFKNSAFEQALYHAKKYNTAVHLMGLLTDGESAHASPEHLYALLDFFAKNNQKKVFLHLFTDGRDSLPRSSLKFLKKLREKIKNEEVIATVMGRFYAMDRNKIWSRTELAYKAMVVGKSKYYAKSVEEAIQMGYDRGETDEYLSPTVIVENKKKPIATINDNDVIYFFNARSDRARQLTKAFVQKDFQVENLGAFKRVKTPKNIRFVAMTDFGPDLPGILTAFPGPDVVNSLAKAIGENYRQLYISETEKYAHVTYFINGGYAAPINGENREVVKSDQVQSYATKPEMNAKKVTDKIVEYINKKRYDFICVNFPNADMVGHTGNFEATKRAVYFLDQQIKILVELMLKNNGQVLLTADHGNAEEKIDLITQEVRTEHTKNPVPCIIISNNTKNKKLRGGGRLADVAPTLLKMMRLEKPKEMTGKPLF